MPRRLDLGDVALLTLGLGAGSSPMFLGFYTAWVWSALGVLVTVVTLTALVLIKPPLRSWSVRLVIVGLGGLGLLSLTSGLWAPSFGAATGSATRTLAYTAMFTAAFILARDQQRRDSALLGLGAGVLLVGVVTFLHLLGPSPGSIFLGGRLSGPLGYAGGTGFVFVMGVWLFAGLAVRPAALQAAAGASGMVLMACLAVLSESRSAVPALGVATVVVLAVEARMRVVWAMLVGGAAAAAATPTLLAVYSHGVDRVSTTAVHDAAWALFGAAAVAGGIWGAAVSVTSRRTRVSTKLNRVAPFALAGLVVVVLFAGALHAGSIGRAAKTQWQAFTHLDTESPTTGPSADVPRLALGGGPLHEYWRVALGGFAADPVLGAGAGSWPKTWFQDRRFYDPVWQPNSILFGTLAELGGTGAAFLALIVAGVVVALRRIRRRNEGQARPWAVAAVGLTVASLCYSTTDWIFVGLPGLMAIGLIALGLLVAAPDVPGGQTDAARKAADPSSRWWRAGLLVLFVVTALLLARGTVSSALTDSSQTALVGHPARAVALANLSLDIDPAPVWTYYVKAAGLARLGRADDARATLLRALRKDPTSFVTLALLGDLDVRGGALDRATAEYRRAGLRDPLDAGVLSGMPSDSHAAVGLVLDRPHSLLRTRYVGYQVLKDLSPLQLARGLGAPGVRRSDVVVEGLFGYGLS